MWLISIFHSHLMWKHLEAALSIEYARPPQMIEVAEPG